METHTSEPIIANRYRLVELLGEGGSGSTYRAIRLDDGMEVAIKILSLRHLNDWKQLELFEREAKVLSQLNHPQIPKYLDYFHIDTPENRAFYIVQQLAPGKSLNAWVQSGWHGTEAEIRDLAAQLLGILQYLHSQSPPLIHRDIKPHNIIRNDDGRVFLVDFGSVQDVYRHTLLKGATVAGTYGYMSPEQFRGEAVPASDLYGLGATILYLLTHRSPADLPQSRLKLNFRSHVNISESFADWLEMTIEPDTSDRFASVEVAIAALEKQHRFRKQPGIKIGFPWKGAAIAAAILLVTVPLIDRYRYAFLTALNLPIHGVCDAIARGDLKSVRGYLDRGVGINSTIVIKEYGYDSYLPQTGSMLHCAIDRKQDDVLKFVLENGADINLLSENRISPLRLAVRTANVSAVKSLLKAGADPQIVDSERHSLWHDLVGASYRYDSDRKEKESIAIAKFLIAAKVDIDRQDLNGDTPLHLAVKNQNLTVISVLLKNQAKTTLYNDRGQTPLIEAISANNFDTVKFLLDKGVGINERDKNGETPLMSLFSIDRYSETRDRFTPQSFTNTTATSVDINSAEGKLMKLLIKRGADLDLVDTAGNNVLHLMLERASKLHPYNEGCNQDRSLAVSTLDLLVKHKIDRRAVNKNGDTALHVAARKDFFPVTERMIKYGWNPRQKNKAGETALDLIAAAKAANPRATRCQSSQAGSGQW